MYYNITGVMKIVVAMIVITVHVLFDSDHSMKRRYIALAKCVVVGQQQQQQQTELSKKERNETIDEKMRNGANINQIFSNENYHF